MVGSKDALALLIVLGMVLSAGPVQDGEGPTTVDCQDGPTAFPQQDAYGAGVQGCFIENLGQWDEHVRFVATGGFGEVAFQDDGPMYMLPGAGAVQAVKVSFGGSDTAAPVGIDETGASYNYLLGNDPGGWVRGARAFRSLVYGDVWPGIDVRYTTSDRGIKYDVIVGEDADPADVNFHVEGDAGLDVADDRLAIRLADGGALRDVDLVAFYGDGEPVDAAFRPLDDGYGFSVDKEPGRTLVIDPLVLPISTFLGGSYTDMALEMVLDAEGNVVIAGTTTSTDYPVTPGAYSEDYSENDLVVTKMDRNCSRVLWSTYIGGSLEDTVTGIALDGEANIHMVGGTRSMDFPVTAGALQTTVGGQYSDDMFVLKLSSDGAALDYSTYIGGLYPETPGDIGVHGGRTYVTGMTESADFPYGGISATYYKGVPFVMVLSEDGSTLDAIMSWPVTRSTRPYAIHVDDEGIVTIAGMTGAWDLPTTPGAYMTEPLYTPRSFVIQCDPLANSTRFATYFGTGYAYISDLALDADGNIYLAGTSMNLSAYPGMELTEGAYCTTYKGRTDTFVTKMDPDGTRLIYSTLAGGNDSDYAGDLEVTREGMAVLVGWLEGGAGFDVSNNSFDQVPEGVFEGFVLVLSEEGNASVHATYMGGQFGDYVTAVELTREDTLMVAGYTESKGFPTTEGAYQVGLAGDRDFFVSELACLYPPSAPLNLTARGGDGNITLGWEPPRDDAGYPVLNYTVHRMASGDGEELVRVTGGGRAFTDEDVEYGTYYTYRVSAFNGKGIGPLSNGATARTVAVPDPPGNLTGKVEYDHVRLTWMKPAFTGGLPLKEYNVYRGVEGGKMEVISRVQPFQVTFVDPNVEDRDTYTYVLAATNEVGESLDNPSVTLRVTGAPTPPRYLDHTYGDLFICLTWEGPEDDFDLPVSRYYVYRTVGDVPDQVVGVVTAPTMTLTDRTVDVGVLYRYNVVAENGKGRSDPSGTVEAMTMVAPDAPRDVEATASELFVRIAWRPSPFDGASPITSYRVYLGAAPDDAVLLGYVNVAGVDEPSLVFLHELAYDGVARQYFVTAMNAEGESVPSGTAWTLMYQVPSPPRSLLAEWGDGEVALTWSAPETDGGTPVTHYRLFRREAGGDPALEVATVPASTLRFVDGELSNGVQYTYWSTAWNIEGGSGPSLEATAMPAGAPAPPEAVVAEGLNGSVAVRWDAPGWNGGLPITGYRVYRISEGTQAELLSDLGPGDREFVQDGLVNGMVYLYAVQAFSLAGESELSAVAEGRPVGAPTPPQALLAFWSDGTVHVTWSYPMDDGGAPIAGYYLRREDWSEGNWTEVTAPGTIYTDGDVEHDGTYNYTVYAYNDVGISPLVTISITVPPEQAEPADDPDGQWPWLVLGAAVAVLAVAMALWRRPRPPEADVDEFEGEG